MVRKTRFLLNLTIAVVLALMAVYPAAAMPIVGGDSPTNPAEPVGVQTVDGPIAKPKGIDQPNPIEFQRNQERLKLMDAGQLADAAALAKTGTTKVLVLLVDFAGTDTFTWNPGDHWDPLGIADPNEFTGTVGDCSNIITTTQTFTYTGPLHNQIDRPVSPDDRSGQSIWTEDFNKQWYDDFMFGQGVVFSYTMQDNTPVFEDFTGQSVTDYYHDMSGDVYTVTGDVVGWIPVAHSTAWYDADQCPGARSGTSVQRGGVIPGAGSTKDLVRDALDEVNAQITAGTLTGFDWTDYDGNGDGYIDSLWLVHAGYGEEDGDVLLNRTDYGESAVWSHSSSITPYVVDPVNNISAYSYIMMPENGGMAVFAHEFGHNIGADDLYSYGDGETSAGFWTLMANSWVDQPIGFGLTSFDPWHMDYYWGWLDNSMMVITDTSKVYTFTLGQASDTPAGDYRAAKIELPDGEAPLPVPVWDGTYYWYGGADALANGKMTLNTAITIPGAATTATLSFDTAYGIEPEWDFLWVQASTDMGTTWNTLTNTHTLCTHDPDWIGEINGFPANLCAANIGGFYGYNDSFPAPDTETFDLSAYAGQDVLIRFWYMTDWGTQYEGAYVDNVVVSVDDVPVFSDDAETDGNWTYTAPWIRSYGQLPFSQNFYYQWRNTAENGGYDRSLGDPRWRYGPANTGMVAWYNNNFYTDNEIYSYMTDYPSIGPKGRMLVLDSQPAPYRDPNSANIYSDGLSNEQADVTNRCMVRDATFSTNLMTPDFTVTPPTVITDTTFTGRDAKQAFHNSLGYYPGLELTKISPTSSNRYYTTRDWDSSAVMPATKSYSVYGPAAYPLGANTVRPLWSVNLGVGTGWYYLTGGAADVGSGNPAEVDGQYGWHVEVVDQAADGTSATVRVWNSMYAADTQLAADKSEAGTDEVVTFDLTFENTGSASVFMVCVPLELEPAGLCC